MNVKAPAGHLSTHSPQDIHTESLRGLLAKVAALIPFQWREILTSYLEYAVTMRKRWQGDKVGKRCRTEVLHEMVVLSSQKAVQNFLAALPTDEWLKTTGPASNKRIKKKPGDFLVRIAESVCGEATQTSKEICLAILQEENRPDLFEQGLSDLEITGDRSPSFRYLKINRELMVRGITSFRTDFFCQV